MPQLFDFPSFLTAASEGGANVFKVSYFKGEILIISQLTYTCSNSVIETLEEGVKYVHS